MRSAPEGALDVAPANTTYLESRPEAATPGSRSRTTVVTRSARAAALEPAALWVPPAAPLAVSL